MVGGGARSMAQAPIRREREGDTSGTGRSIADVASFGNRWGGGDQRDGPAVKPEDESAVGSRRSEVVSGVWQARKRAAWSERCNRESRHASGGSAGVFHGAGSFPAAC